MMSGSQDREQPCRTVVAAGVAERNTPFRVGLVTDVYPPRCGGSGWSTRALARTLLDRGHTVDIFVVDPQGSGVSQRRFEGLPITCLGIAAARRSIRRRLGAHDYGTAMLQRYLEAELDQRGGIDLLHAQHLHSGPAAIAAARSRGRGAILTLRDHWPVCLHGTAWWGGKVCPGCGYSNLTGCMKEYWGVPEALGLATVPWSRRRLAARRRGVARAHAVIAVSHALAERIEPQLRPVQVEVIPNIVDGDETIRSAAASKEDPLVGLPAKFLLLAAKLTATKGIQQLMQALSLQSLQWSLVIAGSGPQEPFLRQRARELRIDARFLGWLSHDRLLSVMQGAQAVIVPSVSPESLSRVLLESMALSTPVIAWATGGSPEIVAHNDTGWLVSPDDSATDLAHALENLADEGRRRHVGAQAAAAVQAKFSAAKVYPLLERLYAAAVSQAARSP